MDIGDIGFLIIAFIVFIINFLAKAKKDKAQAEAEKRQPTKSELPQPWEEQEILPPLLEKVFNRGKMVEAIKKKTTRIPIPSSQESFENAKIRLQVSHEGMSSLSESLYKEDESENLIYNQVDSSNSIYTEGLIEGDVTEELKKAIIYSEILHRKYE